MAMGSHGKRSETSVSKAELAGTVLNSGRCGINTMPRIRILPFDGQDMGWRGGRRSDERNCIADSWYEASTVLMSRSLWQLDLYRICHIAA